MRAILVRTGKTSEIKDYSTFRKLQRDLNIRADEVWETFELEGIPDVGIVARNQDLKHLKPNRLEIKGDFIIMGMKRDGKGGSLFMGLQEQQANDLKLSLTWTTYNNAVEALNGEGED